MDLSQPTKENLTHMIESIVQKLKMASVSVMKPETFDLERYDEVRDIYELVMSKNHFSISEMEAIVSELGQLRRI
jgi:uncharacterized protein YfkK (UPF0435 family)